MAGIFRTCQARENAQAIDHLFDMSEQIFSSVHHRKNAPDPKIFVVSKELQVHFSGDGHWRRSVLTYQTDDRWLGHFHGLGKF